MNIGRGEEIYGHYCAASGGAKVNKIDVVCVCDPVVQLSTRLALAPLSLMSQSK